MTLDERLRSMSKPMAVMIGLILAAIVFWYMDKTEYYEQRIQNVSSQLSQNKDKLEKTQRAVADAEEWKRKTEQDKAQFRDMLQFMPVNLSPADFMTTIDAKARETGAELLNSQPHREESVSPLYNQVRVDVEVQGTFVQLMRFLSSITQIRQIINMGQMVIETSVQDPVSPVLKLKGSLIAYSYNIEEANAVTGGGGSAGQ